MVDWHSLRHAYGPADDVPRLLQGLVPDPKATVWDELWSRVCHQGSTYAASPHVLGPLLALAERWPPPDRIMPLAMAASIVVGEPADGEREDLLRGFESQVARLGEVAVNTLALPGWSLSDFVSLLQAVLAFNGDVFWGSRLDCLLGGEFSGVCPACQHDLYLVVGEYGFFVTSEEWVNHPATKRVAIAPADPSALQAVGAWLLRQATDSDQTTLRQWLRSLFGTSTCPCCTSPISIVDAAQAGV